MNNNFIVTINVNLNELDLLLTSLTKRENSVRDLKDKIFNEANSQVAVFNKPASSPMEENSNIEEIPEEENLNKEGENFNE